MTTPGDVVRRYARCWQDGDLVGLLDCYGEHFVLHYGGSSRFAGSHHGRDAALAVLADVSTVAPRQLLSIDDVLDGERFAALVVTERLTRDGESADLRRVLMYRVEGDRLAECWLHETDQATVDHFWR